MYVDLHQTIITGLQCNDITAITRSTTSTEGMQSDKMGHHLLHLYASAVPEHKHPAVRILYVDEPPLSFSSSGYSQICFPSPAVKRAGHHRHCCNLLAVQGV